MKVSSSLHFPLPPVIGCCLQSAVDIDGHEVHLSKYAGKVVIVVNVASACGFTDANYKGGWGGGQRCWYVQSRGTGEGLAACSRHIIRAKKTVICDDIPLMSVA